MLLCTAAAMGLSSPNGASIRPSMPATWAVAPPVLAVWSRNIKKLSIT